MEIDSRREVSLDEMIAAIHRNSISVHRISQFHLIAAIMT
jgi:hypothetical protein